MRTKPRFIVSRVLRDRRAPARYQRSGWVCFDTAHPTAQNLGVWPTRAEAQAEADRCNARYVTDRRTS